MSIDDEAGMEFPMDSGALKTPMLAKDDDADDAIKRLQRDRSLEAKFVDIPKVPCASCEICTTAGAPASLNDCIMNYLHCVRTCLMQS